MSFHLSLLLTVILLDIANAVVYNIKSDDSKPINVNSTDSSQNLAYYLKNASKYFSSYSYLHFEVGRHYLSTDLVIQNAVNVIMIGESLCFIRCTSHVIITIFNVTNFKLQNIIFDSCNGKSFHTDIIYDHISISEKVNTNASILLLHCMSVEINKITIIINEGNTGMILANVKNFSKITDVSITVQVNCLSRNNTSLHTYGIMLYYDSWRNPYNESAKILLDNFCFTTNGSCPHAMHYAITSLLFQNNANVSVVIQNTVFSNLVNVNALYYYAKVCGISVNNHLAVRNSVIFNNTGNLGLKMFHITLYNIQCIDVTVSDFHLQQYSNISFANCKFMNNFNMQSILYISPASSQATTGYFYLVNNTFDSNRNTHILIMKNDAENIWQLSNYFNISNTQITSNVHNEGQNLLSFTNSWVIFSGPIIIMHNHYYFSIWKFYLSIPILQYNIDILNNTAWQIMSCSFVFMKDNAMLNISSNSLYIIAKQNFVYTMKSIPLCTVQFYSKFNSFNVSKLPVYVTISNNIHMLSKDLPDSNAPFECKWLAGNSFQKAGLRPEFVNTKVFKIYDNKAVSSKVSRRPIPMSICKCKKPGPRSGTEFDSEDHSDCYSPHLGSIFPGETLKVKLILKKSLSLHCRYPMPILAINTKHDDCSIVDLSQFSQTCFNNGCNSYSYTLWPKSEEVKVCELFIGLSDKPEMFYVKLKPCPLGFKLQENRQACYCDPVLTENEVVLIRYCNLSDESILRPAYSWIYAKKQDNASKFVYTLSSYCPFDHCLPHESQLNLSNPDSQCQFNRTGLLCGECQKGLSGIFGTQHCKHCSNIYLLIIVPIVLAGIVFVILLYFFNLTIRNGTVNTCIFYINIMNTSVAVLFPNCQSFICAMLYGMNFDITSRSCFYNGMDDYAKAWLKLVLSFYLISIATVFIIMSRYSTAVQRLTAKRALPVLATLILFTYTKILIIVCNVLFRYSSITHLPSNKTELVWSISTTTPLFGLKFLTLTIVCIILFLILLTFNLILIFTRTLSCLKLVTTFKPLLDTYFGAYKDRAYYWTGLLLLVRVTVYALSAVDEDISLVVITVLLGGLLCVHAAVQPFKTKFHNIQECITILNLLTFHAALLYKRSVGLKIAMMLIRIGVIYFMTAIVLHCCMHRLNSLIHKAIKWLLNKFSTVKNVCNGCKFCKVKMSQKDNSSTEIKTLSSKIADVTYNYKVFREPLLALDPDK